MVEGNDRPGIFTCVFFPTSLVIVIILLILAPDPPAQNATMINQMVSHTTFTLDPKNAAPAFITTTSQGCPYHPGSPAMVAGTLTTDGLAGDNDHIRVWIQNTMQPNCQASGIMNKNILGPEADRRLASRKAMHDLMKSMPPDVMQDAIAMANHR